MLLEYPDPDRCVVDAVGEPGHRLFVIQVSQGDALTSVAVEKEQVRTLGRRIGEILDQLQELGQIEAPVAVPVDSGPLDAPIELEFRVGAIGLAWDQRRGAVQLELFSVDLGEGNEEEEGEEDDRNVLVQIWLHPRRARAFSERARRVVASGRTICPFCGQPIDAGGHICPRSNGYRAPLFR